MNSTLRERVFARFNTQPPEGGWLLAYHGNVFTTVSTHSRPKAAGNPVDFAKQKITVSTHSRPKAAGVSLSSQSALSMFQHTAARRRLVFHATALPAR